MELFAGGTILLTFGIICISFLCTGAFIAGTWYFVMQFYKQNQKRAEDLMRVGTEGQAKILSLQDTGMRLNDNPRVSMLLEITLPGQAPYQLTKTVTVPLIKLSQIQPGSVVTVVVDMADMTNPDKVGLKFN